MEIRKLLEKKHSKDIIVFECKNGQTWDTKELRILDAWVLKRTYNPLTFIGYEIKENRYDFEQDQKWTRYLDLCHEFYFVCPAGLIKSVDLPSYYIGLIWATKSRLHIKRKAERINPDMNKVNKLLLYILMSRIKIIGAFKDKDKLEKCDLIKNKIEEANIRGELASFVKGHIRKVYEEIKNVELSFEFREKAIKEFENKLKLLGIEWNSNAPTHFYT